MWETCPEIVVSVGSAAEADPLLTALLSNQPALESALQWLRNEAIPQAIRCLVEQVLKSERDAENIRPAGVVRSESPLTPTLSPLRKGREGAAGKGPAMRYKNASSQGNSLLRCGMESPLTPTLSPLRKGGEGAGSGGILFDPKIEVSVWLTTNDEIASLNARYRGINAPTDVLSFPAEVPMAPMPEIPLGDVVVSVEQAAQQAELNGHDFLTELLMLCLHGTLHLLGYDDRTEAQRARMNQLAARTLRALGYAAKEEWSSRHYEG